MRLTPFQMLLWLAPAVLESVIAMVMLYRKLWRDLPIFFSYLIFEVARTCFLFAERSNDNNYFYAYWVTEAVGCLAAFCVIKELFDNAFERHLGLRHLGNVLFQWSLALLLAAALLIAWTSPGADVTKIMAGILIVKRTVTFVEAGLLAFLFLFAFAFGIGWQHYATGVCLGIGIYGAVEVIAITARAVYGPVANHTFNSMVMAANNCSVLIWAAYFLLPIRHTINHRTLGAEHRLEEWNEALLQLLKR
jgi:hypothetical protein